MKILIIMGGYFPGKKFGGPPVSVSNFCELMTDIDTYIITSDHDMCDKTPYSGIKKGWNQRGKTQVLYLSDKDYNYKTFKDKILELHPDIIYLQGLFQECIIPCLWLARQYKIRVLLAPRGELCRGAFKKKYKKIPYILFLKLFDLIGKNVHFQATSDEELRAINKILRISKDRIHFLTNVPVNSSKKYQYKKKEQGSLNLIFVSRIVKKKNLLGALEILKKINGNIKFDIYGPIEDSLYWNKCQAVIKELPKNISVKYCGMLEHAEILDTFSKYDGFLFPTYSENFGHVIAESLVAGCPVIISDRTPWNNVNEFNAGFAIELDNVIEFRNKIDVLLSEDDKSYKIRRDNIKTYLNKKLNILKCKIDYLRVFNLIIKNKRN